MTKHKKPRILCFDLETGGINGLRSDLACMLNFGYKYVGDKKARVLTIDQYKGWFSTEKGLNDRGITEAALEIMNEADLLVAHYGDRFDRKFLAGRCAIHGLKPPSPTKMRDTWMVARTNFNFSSNRLKSLATTLGLKNHKMEKGSGWPSWWIKAMAGNRKAIHAMARYCKQDVQTLEELYLRLQPFDQPAPRLVLDRTRCGNCGERVHYRGYALVATNRYRRYQCSKCGKWGKETRIVKGDC